MPQISKRAEALPPSPIRKLVPYADAAKEKGIKVLHLNIGQPDIETPPSIMKAVAEYAQKTKVLEYSHSAGNYSLRNKQILYYQRLGIDLKVKDILITTGGSEAIIFAMMVALNPGDEIIIPEPFYANYNGFATIAGVNVVPVRSYIESGFALPPIAEIEAKITSKTKAILICNPNNPTGYLYSKDDLNAIAALVKKHNLFLFSDEAYKEFCYDDNHPFMSALQLEDISQQVIMFDTISKRYSSCGGRIGALITRNTEFTFAALKLAQARLSPPSFAQVLAEAAVDLPLDYFDAIKENYLIRRNALVNRLNQMPGVFCPMPKGAFYAIARLPIDDSNAFCQWLLEHFQHDGYTVMLAPASGFYASPNAGINEVRLAYVLEVSLIEKAMDCLALALQQYPNRIETK